MHPQPDASTARSDLSGLSGKPGSLVFIPTCFLCFCEREDGWRLCRNIKTWYVDMYYTLLLCSQQNKHVLWCCDHQVVSSVSSIAIVIGYNNVTCDCCLCGSRCGVMRMSHGTWHATRDTWRGVTLAAENEWHLVTITITLTWSQQSASASRSSGVQIRAVNDTVTISQCQDKAFSLLQAPALVLLQLRIYAKWEFK